MLFPPRSEQPLPKRQKADRDADTVPVTRQPMGLRHVTMRGTFGVLGGDGSADEKKKNKKKGPKERPDLSIPVQMQDQLLHDGFESLGNLADDLQPSLRFVLPPPRDAMRQSECLWLASPVRA